MSVPPNELPEFSEQRPKRAMRSGNEFIFLFTAHRRMKRLEFVSLRFRVFGPDFLDVGFEFVAARRHIKSVKQFDCSFAGAVLGLEVISL